MGIVDWWHSRKQAPVETLNDSPGPSPEEDVEPNTDNASDHSQPQEVPADENEAPQEEAVEEPVQKKGFLERFSFFKKAPPTPEVGGEPMASEDVFSPSRRKGKRVNEYPKKGKNSNLEDSSSADDFVRIKVWLRRNRSEPFRPAKFCDCLVDYFASADRRNIYSAPAVQIPGSILNVPHSGRSVRDPSDKSSIHSSNEHLSWSGLTTPFGGCCSVNRSALPSSSRSSGNNHSCCLHSPKTEAISVTVECILQDNRVLMQPAPEDAFFGGHQGRRMQSWRRSGSSQTFIAVLEHPPFCCAHRISPKDYADLPDEDKQRGVDVGVAVLLESSDNRVLITRRAQHMRTFPGVWVPPGGHIDDGETVIEAAMREVFEETGLYLVKGKAPGSIFLKLSEDDGKPTENSDEFFDDDEVNRYSLLGLWESCFPPVLYVGTPKKQHLVYYIHVALSQPADVIEKHLKLEPSEVSACAWLERSHVEVVAYSSRPLPDAPIPITVVGPNSDNPESGTLDPKVLRKKMPEPTREVERLTTGTRFALKLWLGPLDDREVSQPSVGPKVSEPSVEAEPSEPSAEPEASEPSAEPEASEPSAEPEASEPSAEPEASEPSAEPEASEPSAEPEASEPSIGSTQDE